MSLLFRVFFTVVLPWATTHRITLHPYVSVGWGNWSVFNRPPEEPHQGQALFCDNTILGSCERP